MGSRTVCFVCGNVGAETVLYIKNRPDKGPFFPFLEDHEPPKGCRLPGSDGIVDSCRVCHAFLTQQWETYERTRTPSVKRLYWLKRCDNGQFTGAEMRLQGEYIAQVMGLQYNPASVDSGFHSSSPTVLRAGQGRVAPENYLSCRPTNDGALDLSVHKNSGRDFRSNNGSNGSVIDLQSKETTIDMQPKLLHDLQSKETLLDLQTKAQGKDRTYVCFTCGTMQPCATRRFISAYRQSNTDPYYPFLARLSPQHGAVALSDEGIAVVCSTCRRSLYQEWKNYELGSVPIENRVYHINNKEFLCDLKERSREYTCNQNEKFPASNVSCSNSEVVCYLCGQLVPEKSSRLLHTLLPKDGRQGTRHFPFVRDLPRPEGAHPLNPDGTVISCKMCYDHLASQWHMFESQGVSLAQRHFSLPVSTNRRTYSYDSGDHSNFLNSEDVSQPLNIQISGSPVPTVPSGSQGLLAIATPISSSSSIQNNDICRQGVSSPVTNTQYLTAESRHPSTESKANSNTIPHPLQQVSNLPKKICFLCGETCLVANLHVLCSYPARHDAKVPNGQCNPFFPFLANRDPAPGADTMSDEGTVVSCQYCYHMLLNQWSEYEISKAPGTNNRWLRKYFLKNFICYVCSRVVERKKVCSLEVLKFPFLKEHKVPAGALIMDNGECVVVCKTCSRSLIRQFSEFERMGLPVELRKYNWIQRGQLVDDGLDEGDSQAVPEENDFSHGLPQPGNEEDGNLTIQLPSGVPQGAKPPPLTMVNSSTSKVTRNTATVQPLNQVSPSNSVTAMSGNAALNATRTSSFAAALRKLANQAKEPDDVPSIKTVPPSTTSVSPRASTPKRGPPPLVYSSQSSSSYLTSPPVVTIAPTQAAHSTHIHSDAHGQNLERTHSVQSCSSSLYDPLSVKHEHRPLSSHSRDGDSLSSKESSLIQPPHRAVPPSVSTQGHRITREDQLPRGFQPYRPEEDLRPMMPSPFGLDPTYPYHAALFAHQPYPHPAFSRIDDPLVLDRCRLMHPPFMSFGHPGMIPPHGVHPFLATSRYPPDVIHQQYPFIPSSSRLPGYRSSPGPAPERTRSEEDKMKRFDSERELERVKERELQRERELEHQKEREREQEKERERAREHERLQCERRELEREKERERRKAEVNYTVQQEQEEDRRHSMQAEIYPVSSCGSITQGTPREVIYNADKQRLAPQSMSNGIPEVGPMKRYEESHMKHEEIRQPSPVQFDDQRKHKILSKNDFTVANISKDRHHLNHHHHLQHHHNAQDKSHVKMECWDRVDARPKPPPLVPPRSQNDLDKNEKAEKIFRPYDGLSPYRYTNHQYSDHNNKANRDSRTNRTNDSKHNVSNDTVLQRGSLSKDEAQLDVHSSICSQVTNFKHLHPNNHQVFEPCFSYHEQYQQDGNSDCSHSSHTEPPVVSRLDVEEKKMREARSNGTYCSDSENEDTDVCEVTKRHLMLITSGPPLKLDRSPRKLRYLKILGLTTQTNKKDVEFERLRKRKRMFREPSVSPVPLEDELPQESPLTTNIESEQLRLEPDYRHKCRFLHWLGLLPLSGEKKKELEQIRQACDEERSRRLQLSECKQEDALEKTKQEESNSHSVKRKFSEVEGISQVQNKTERPPTKISLNQLQERYLSAQQKPNTIAPQSSGHENRAIIFPESRDRRLSKEFAQEFHESVLQTTRQKELANRLGLSSTKSSEEENKPLVSDTSNQRLSQDAVSTKSEDSRDSVHLLRWPGVETVLEAYQRHLEEQKLEKIILHERCQKLKTENSELNRGAEKLSRHMSKLLESKKLLDDEKKQLRRNLENLQQCLQLPR